MKSLKIPIHIKNHSDYKTFRKKRWIALLFPTVLCTIGFFLRNNPIKDIRIIADILFSGSLLLLFCFVFMVIKKPKVWEGTIQTIEPYKSIWLNPPEGHKYFVSPDDSEMIYSAECLHGRVSGTENTYEIKQNVYVLQFSKSECYILAN